MAGLGVSSSSPYAVSTSSASPAMMNASSRYTPPPSASNTYNTAPTSQMPATTSKDIFDDDFMMSKGKTSTYSNSTMPRCKALYQFEGRSGDELSFEAGDVINVIDKKADGWWVGEIRGKQGVFPGNYTQEL